MDLTVIDVTTVLKVNFARTAQETFPVKTVSLASSSSWVKIVINVQGPNLVRTVNTNVYMDIKRITSAFAIPVIQIFKHLNVKK